MLNDYYQARDYLELILRKDLLGPVDDAETIDDLPSNYYIIGRLFPQGMQLRQEDNERSGLTDEADGAEQAVNMSYSAYPSSMAISFTVKSDVKELVIDTTYAWYEIVENKTEETDRRSKPAWKRNQNNFSRNFRTTEVFQQAELHSGLELRIYLQKTYSDGSKTFTVCMINNNHSSSDLVRDNELTFFQPGISVKSSKYEEAVFIEKQSRVMLSIDEEVLTLEMLYRHNKTFGAGHGCSVGWTADGDNATEVYSDYLPGYDLYLMKPAFHVSEQLLAFKTLSEQSQIEVCNNLNAIADSYAQWIIDKRENIKHAIDDRHKSVANENINKCEEALDRIREGIKLLESDEMVFDCFKMVNEAMLLQRIKHNAASDPEAHTWYPFQLAFILQEITSIVNPHDKYRDTVDLLWFPTGGGKTEAYLGLTAFTIFLRRMKAIKYERSDDGAGVTVLMRYTLRLLTLQQFERAAALICACEIIRFNNEHILGTKEIAIGLWVGGGLTPNKREDAKKALNTILDSSGAGYNALREDEANPCQVLSCPWCKTEIKPAQYHVDSHSMKIKCTNLQCEFRDRLPLYLVDEDIYDFRPALVVGTIDKFARMTWEKKVGLLFGIQVECLPPELIIQDELHLIAGPLGTVAGLYETAIDQFCISNGIKAKIISSTATIRNARSQILSLYGRDFRQFPPQGLDIRDSYFAKESLSDEQPARKYIGLLASGTSGNTFLIRVYSIIILATRYLKEKGHSDQIVDSYWTIIGYFNSLKQLGGAVVNVIDDVQGRLVYLRGKKFKDSFSANYSAPENQNFDELTSRKANSEIGEILKKLDISYPNINAYDLVLASNMLSVGVDVGRLGIMVLQGQPKTNSEYIQATSRIGRQKPGLVLTMYDASRSRDRSHYEQFRSYHSSLYRYVEATSLTPFAERARDRALHAAYISLCRHLINGLRGNNDAEMIDNFLDEARQYIEIVLDRVKIVDQLEYDSCKDHLEWILDEWVHASGQGLTYQKIKNSGKKYLLTDRFDSNEEAFPTLNSMRNVDVECEVRLEG